MHLTQLLLLASYAAASPAAQSIPEGLNTFTCGQTFTTLPTVSASGSVTCSNNVPAPTENALFRIEGNDADGTIFEGCIVSEPQVITTPSGGSHECDGTNNGANSSPGATATDQIASAGQLIGFGFDGTFDSDFDDFFITSIGNSMETSTEFWGLLQNGQFTPSGGCQTETTNTDVTLWAFNAFNAVYFLQVTPEYAVVEAGSGTITVTITDAQTNQPVPGSVLGGQTADSNGHVTITIPANQGCYQMKATQSDAIRSNAFYLTVVDSFGSNPSGPF
ncbi:hypothetical protein F5Y16DRAFT_411665 [Xylariaceae sp. FL0255]|nr:hypothetical protein F5Y16DRAFT_411665 [Xylariaceae sp. FL0255]